MGLCDWLEPYLDLWLPTFATVVLFLLDQKHEHVRTMDSGLKQHLLVKVERGGGRDEGKQRGKENEGEP